MATKGQIAKREQDAARAIERNLNAIANTVGVRIEAIPTANKRKPELALAYSLEHLATETQLLAEVFSEGGDVDVDVDLAALELAVQIAESGGTKQALIEAVLAAYSPSGDDSGVSGDDPLG
jgi:hypothetical protein